MSITLDRVKRISYREFKDICQILFFRFQKEKNIVFLLGCQRSGTTILSEVIEKDFRTKVYKESHSKTSSKDPSGLRIDPLPILKKEIFRNKTKTIVIKPLVESQHTNQLLSDFPESKVIWVLREYKGVISSDIKKFGPKNGTENLRKILEEDTWRSENMSKHTLSLIQKYYKPKMSQYEAAALFWYSRNVLFFDQDLDKNKKITICKYEDLVTEPKKTMQRLYKHINYTYPKKNITARVFSSSVTKGKDILLNPEIALLCDNLLVKLNKCNN